jgi:hypothetical protein
MIYMKTVSGSHIIVIEPDNIDKMKAGEPLHTPDNEVMVCFTPDIEWVQDQFIQAQMAGTLGPETIEDVLKRSLVRPEVKNRIYHPMIDHTQTPGEA